MTGLKKAVAAAALLVMMYGCATGAQRGYVMAPDAANYTNKYIRYSLRDTKDKPFGLGGDANPFNKGGAANGDCCAALPGPGQTIRIVWSEAPPGSDDGQKHTYTKDVAIIGSQPLPGDAYNYLIVRFFPDQQLEVEFVSELVSGPRSPRLDRIFYGERVMRHIGE
jgi:hypothetical protein